MSRQFTLLHYYSAHSPLGLFSDRLHRVLRLLMLLTRLKTHRLLQVDIDRREQCCAANYEQVVNHVVPSCYSWTMLQQHVDSTVHSGPHNLVHACRYQLATSCWFSQFLRMQLRLFIFTTIACDITFLTMFILIHLVNNGYRNALLS
jgi:hypothetical protein